MSILGNLIRAKASISWSPLDELPSRDSPAAAPTVSQQPEVLPRAIALQIVSIAVLASSVTGEGHSVERVDGVVLIGVRASEQATSVREELISGGDDRGEDLIPGLK